MEGRKAWNSFKLSIMDICSKDIEWQIQSFQVGRNTWEGRDCVTSASHCTLAYDNPSFGRPVIKIVMLERPPCIVHGRLLDDLEGGTHNTWFKIKISVSSEEGSPCTTPLACDDR